MTVAQTISRWKITPGTTMEIRNTKISRLLWLFRTSEQSSRITFVPTTKPNEMITYQIIRSTFVRKLNSIWDWKMHFVVQISSQMTYNKLFVWPMSAMSPMFWSRVLRIGCLVPSERSKVVSSHTSLIKQTLGKKAGQLEFVGFVLCWNQLYRLYR